MNDTEDITLEYEFSEHASDMMKERDIKEAWVKSAMDNPQKKEEKQDGTIHYIRAIEQYGGRHLRVIVNPEVRPQRIVTVFFDRRIKVTP